LGKNKRKIKGTVLLIKVSKINEKGPIAAEQMFSAIHGIIRKSNFFRQSHKDQEQISFEIVSSYHNICFYVWAPSHLKDFIEGVKSFSICELETSKHSVFPLKRFEEFDDKIGRVNIDPLSSITESMRKSSIGESEQVWLQIVIKPIKDYWLQKISERTVDLLTKNKEIFLFKFLGNEKIITTDIRWYYRMLLIPIIPILWALNIIFNIFSSSGGGFIRATTVDENGDNKNTKTLEYNTVTCKALVEKASKAAFETAIRIVYVSGAETDKRLARQKVFSVAASFRQFHSSVLNGFNRKFSHSRLKLRSYINREVNSTHQYLNTEELATMYHLPNILVETPGILWVTSKKLEPPNNLPTFKNTPENELTLIGTTNYRGYKEEFGMLPDDRRRHIYIIGINNIL